MKLIFSRKVWYTSFLIGGEPSAIPCELRIVEAGDGKRYVQTPYAFYPALGDDDHSLKCLSLPGHGYHATEEEARTFLRGEYPNWLQARPLMEALEKEIRWNGELVGHSRVADQAEASSFRIYTLARGHRQHKLKEVQAAVKALARNKSKTRV